ncbi:MAG: M48 family metallopeptidase [Desulfobacterales bacterium]|nr:M48 family metallopeptidase [Desulfobacterales bacterium]
MIHSHPLISGAPELQGWALDIIFKPIRHIYFRLDPRKRRIRISAPRGVSPQVLDRAIAGKLAWMIRQVQGFQNKSHSPEGGARPRPGYVQGAIHHVAGKPHRLSVFPGRPRVELMGEGELMLQAPEGATQKDCAGILDQWYRNRLRSEARPLVKKWEPVLGVRVHELRIRRMKTRWGSCNVRAHRVWLALNLAQVAPELMEYGLVHEMVHLLEPSHNRRFHAFMDQFLPRWKALKQQLNASSSFLV